MTNLIDIDLQTDICDALSDSETVYTVPNPIYKLRSYMVERVSVFNLVPMIINAMYLVGKHTLPGAERYQKIDLVVMLLATYPELNDTQHLHHSLVEKMYLVAEHDTLKQIQQFENPSCCACDCTSCVEPTCIILFFINTNIQYEQVTFTF